jgi:cyclic pyranopterin phosphate synthase
MLRDRFGRTIEYLRLSVTDRCDLRCTYCMPTGFKDFEEPADWLTFDEIERLLAAFARLGTRRVRLTGGEPLLRANLADLVGDLTSIPGIEDVALTTNGILLAQHAVELQAAGLQRVTVSLDTLDPEVFRTMSGGLGEVADVLAGIDQARRAGLAPIKVNAVVQRGLNDHTVLDLLDRFRDSGIIVRFIEYMDVGNRNHWDPGRVVSSSELLQQIGARWPLEPLEKQYRGEVAERYAFTDGRGEIGFISSVSQPFCGDCSRARLSSDGLMYTCLFATQGVSLRDTMRGGASDDALLEQIRGIWLGRTDRYSEQRATLRATSDAKQKIEMYYIGG